MSTFSIFLGLFVLLIGLGVILILRDRIAAREHSSAALGLAIGLVVGGAVGLTLSLMAGTFVILLPASVGVGMALGLGAGTMLEPR